MSASDPEDRAETGDSKSEPETHDTATGSAGRRIEIGGRGGLDPTRYGDWEKAGRCIDF